MTSSQPGPPHARSHASASAPSSLSRPTRGESKRRSAAAVETVTSRHAGHGLTLALQRQRLDGLRLDRVSSQAQSRLAEQGLTGLRGLLQPRGNVDGVTRREPLLGARDHLAATDADPPLDAELGQGQLHLRRCLERAHCIVFVHGRQPEDRHHGVADELLDDAAMALDDRLHALEIAREQRTERLRVERLAERRRTGDVAKQHGHDLPLLPPLLTSGRTTFRAIPEGLGSLVPADGASRHRRSIAALR